MLLAVLGVVASDGLCQDPANAAADSAKILGRNLYLKQYCGLCHTFGRADTRGIIGPTHDGLAETSAARLADPSYNGKATTVEDYVRESITHPEVYMVPGFETAVHRMPPYRHLPDAEIDAIVRFLLEVE